MVFIDFVLAVGYLSLDNKNTAYKQTSLRKSNG